MCRGAADVPEHAHEALADLLYDMAVALCPEAPESVLIGPIDLGSERCSTCGHLTIEHSWLDGECPT